MLVDAAQHQGAFRGARPLTSDTVTGLHIVCVNMSAGVGFYLLFREKKKCNYVMGKRPSLDPQSVSLLGKESGVIWSSAPPSSLNGGIPSNHHVLSHVSSRGHVLGWLVQGKKRKKLLPVSTWETLVS